MIEVFKTNVQEFSDARHLVTLLQTHFPDSKVNFDLDDCDKVLRVEAPQVITETIMTLVTQKGFLCTMLD